jgi:acetyl esterase
MRLFLSLFVVSISMLSTSLKAQKRSERVQPEIITYKKIDTISLRLYVYKPKVFVTAKQYPCVVFFHGGGWNGGSYKAFERQSQYLASRGIIAISATYRLKKKHGTSPFEAVKDAKSAIRYIRENAKELSIDPNKLAAGGGSAGGHLAAVCGTIAGINEATDNMTISAVPTALILFNPVYDNSKNGYGYRAISGRVNEISPLHNIREGVPPTLVFFGTEDHTTPLESSIAFEEKMIDVGSRIDLHLYEGQQHSFFNRGTFFNDTVSKMDDFLVSLDFLEGKETVEVFFK